MNSRKIETGEKYISYKCIHIFFSHTSALKSDFQSSESARFLDYEIIKVTEKTSRPNGNIWKIFSSRKNVWALHTNLGWFYGFTFKVQVFVYIHRSRTASLDKWVVRKFGQEIWNHYVSYESNINFKKVTFPAMRDEFQGRGRKLQNFSLFGEKKA